MSGWYDTVVVKGAKHRVRVGTPAATNSREAFLEIADLTSVQQCIDYGTQWLAAHSTIADQVDLGLQPTAPELTPWDGLGVGDALQYTNRAGDQERGRIHGVGFTGIRRNGEPNWTVTLGSASQERGVVARRQLTGLTQGTMSGTFKAGAVSIAPSFADVSTGRSRSARFVSPMPTRSPKRLRPTGRSRSPSRKPRALSVSSARVNRSSVPLTPSSRSGGSPGRLRARSLLRRSSASGRGPVTATGSPTSATTCSSTVKVCNSSARRRGRTRCSRSSRSPRARTDAVYHVQLHRQRSDVGLSD